MYSSDIWGNFYYFLGMLYMGLTFFEPANSLDTDYELSGFTFYLEGIILCFLNLYFIV